MILGILGIVVPLLPTTPFLLLSSFLFYKGSEKLNKWLLNNRILGEYIYNYKTYHAVKRRTKIFAITFLWNTLSISFYLLDNLIIRLFLIVVGVSVTIHLLSMKTLEKVINN